MSKLQNNNDKGSAKNHRTDEAMQSDVVVNLKKKGFLPFSIVCSSMPEHAKPTKPWNKYNFDIWMLKCAQKHADQ